MRRDVLAADRGEHVLVDPVTGIGKERSARTGRAVQGSGGVAVVDDEGEPPIDGRRQLVSPAVELEADLRPLPGLEDDSFFGQASREIG